MGQIAAGSQSNQIAYKEKSSRSKAQHAIYATGSNLLGKAAILTNHPVVKLYRETSLNLLADSSWLPPALRELSWQNGFFTSLHYRLSF